jgi:hypothetical protein
MARKTANALTLRPLRPKNPLVVRGEVLDEDWIPASRYQSNLSGI